MLLNILSTVNPAGSAETSSIHKSVSLSMSVIVSDRPLTTWLNVSVSVMVSSWSIPSGRCILR